MKLFDRELRGNYKRIPEDAWFELQQPLLLWLANTRTGRDLLCIPQQFPRISALGKNRLTVALGRATDRIQFMTDFRVGSKWANVIRFRWPEFQLAAQFYYANYAKQLSVPFPVAPVPGFAFNTSTFYPDPGSPGTTTCDGRVRQNYGTGAGVSWATIIAAAGNGAFDTAATDDGFEFDADSVSNNFKYLSRGIQLFDTSSLTSSATISSATLSLFGSSRTDTLGDTPNINIYSSAPASNTALTASDFANFGSTAFATAIAYSSFNDAAYNDFALNASGISNISLTGVSKFGTRNASYDVAASAPAWSSLNQSTIQITYADTAGTTSDPKLVVNFTLPGAATTTTRPRIWRRFG